MPCKYQTKCNSHHFGAKQNADLNYSMFMMILKCCGFYAKECVKNVQINRGETIINAS